MLVTAFGAGVIYPRGVMDDTPHRRVISAIAPRIPTCWAHKLCAVGLTGAVLAAAVFGGCATSGEGRGSGGGKGAETTGGDAAAMALPRILVPGIAGEPDMRVRLMAGAASLRASVTVGGALWAAPAGSNRPAAQLATPLEITASATEWLIKDAAGLLGRFPRGTALELAADENAVGGKSRLAGSIGGAGAGGSAGKGKPTARSGSTLTRRAILLSGKRYEGVLRLTTGTGARAGANSFDVVQTTGVEQYLTGVLASELFASWPQQAFSAQAVAARSYALHERARARALGNAFDVEATTANQVYGGSTNIPQAALAVVQTRGVVLTWNTEILRAYFSSTSGGRAASAKDTWPTSQGFEYNLAGPLQAKSREELGRSATHYRWTVLRTRYEMLARLRAWGEQQRHPVRSLKAFETVITETRNPVGRPTRYRVVERGGSGYSLTAEELRRACNQTAPGTPTLTAEMLVRSGDMECTASGDVITLRGRGYGHGVGLCQWSVKELADKGAKWQEIVPRFYPGARLERAY